MKEDFLQFVADIFEVDVERISMETEYQSIDEWDSLMQLRLVGEIEDKYGVEIPIDEVAEIEKLADFYSYIEK